MYLDCSRISVSCSFLLILSCMHPFLKVAEMGTPGTISKKYSQRTFSSQLGYASTSSSLNVVWLTSTVAKSFDCLFVLCALSVNFLNFCWVQRRPGRILSGYFSIAIYSAHGTLFLSTWPRSLFPMYESFSRSSHL